jgi:hypothetical protein
MSPIYHIIFGFVLIGLSIYLIKNEMSKAKKKYSIILLILSITTLIGGIGRLFII